MTEQHETKLAEIDRNLAVFLRVLPSILEAHSGQYALLHHGEIMEYFPSALDAQIAGNQRYQPSGFSIQQVTREPAELGFYAYAVDTRPS
jgi:broad specificity phosphatase PhoE